MNRIQRGLIGIVLPGLMAVSGCQSYFSDVLRGALKSNEVPTSLIGTECESIIRNRAYLTLQECEQEKRIGIKSEVSYRDKREHAICSLQDINDPNFFQLSVDYYNEYPKFGLGILERAYEKKQKFKNKK